MDQIPEVPNPLAVGFPVAMDLPFTESAEGTIADVESGSDFPGALQSQNAGSYVDRTKKKETTQLLCATSH